MRNAFGLKFVYLFFNIPFLCLQRETLKRQLQTNKKEIISSYSELDCYSETPEADYETFIETITQRRRQIAENQGAGKQFPAVAASGRVMGGGQPIPGQNISPTKSSKAHSATSSHSPTAASDSSQGCAGTNSFVMVDGSGDDIDDFLAEEATARTGQRMQRPNNLALSNQRSIGSDDDSQNTMVRTTEDDFMEDDDLSAKMAKLAQERKGSELVKPKNLHLSSAVKQEERSASVTPLAYKVKLSDNDHGSSSGDEFDTPEGDLPLQMEDSPSNSMRNRIPERISPSSSLQSPSSENAEPEEKLRLQFAPSALEPVKLPSPSSNVNQAQNPEASTALAAADFDAWLADDSSHGSSNPINLSQPKWAENDSSDEEIGIKLPQKSEDEERQVKTESSKTKADNVKLDWLIENTQQEPSKETKIRAKKPKKNTEDGTGEEKKKKKSSKKKEEFDEEGVEKGKKVKKTKRKEEKSPRAALEDFLGGELEGNEPEDKDYDPL
ncbi:hypothetical protein WR25_20686 [Diploscapter pachys]|uniref:FAM21/CAPZIP domain-containing protein n=1 Tax=Diploscapter pachys TaxID=2018661 RepID=A0A2A2J5X4_9BILA|nr:hypothetical protein WR25_20686 [Diploscapter pachys]